jgi:hypothetical protein
MRIEHQSLKIELPILNIWLDDIAEIERAISNANFVPEIEIDSVVFSSVADLEQHLNTVKTKRPETIYLYAREPEGKSKWDRVQIRIGYSAEITSSVRDKRFEDFRIDPVYEALGRRLAELIRTKRKRVFLGFLGHARFALMAPVVMLVTGAILLLFTKDELLIGLVATGLGTLAMLLQQWLDKGGSSIHLSWRRDRILKLDAATFFAMTKYVIAAIVGAAITTAVSAAWEALK